MRPTYSVVLIAFCLTDWITPRMLRTPLHHPRRLQTPIQMRKMIAGTATTITVEREATLQSHRRRRIDTFRVLD